MRYLLLELLVAVVIAYFVPVGFITKCLLFVGVFSFIAYLDYLTGDRAGWCEEIE